MWLSDRRGFLCGALALSGAAVSGCGFAPAYGTDGAASKLQNAIHVDEINTHNGYLMTRRIEERLGAGGANAPFTLGLTIGTSQDNLGTTPDGNLTRYQILGRVDFTLRRAAKKPGSNMALSAISPAIPRRGRRLPPSRRNAMPKTG
ncbi:hypothetical protein [Phaeobacter sp. J2-8]|uniref:hypothetical protein n=1 Tax=Phaeobacter sp. J2-8 TaxID=2931394 RepID=UPI001FD047FF|nr:hypothetical protein [Phaeobacter sp. J2-8]MCJ7874186.1 hypothetical protein [Phaeobacter sp. J2-8]